MINFYSNFLQLSVLNKINSFLFKIFTGYFCFFWCWERLIIVSVYTAQFYLFCFMQYLKIILLIMGKVFILQRRSALSLMWITVIYNVLTLLQHLSVSSWLVSR